MPASEPEFAPASESEFVPASEPDFVPASEPDFVPASESQLPPATPGPVIALNANADYRQQVLQDKLVIHSVDDETLPTADILIANILLKPLMQLAPRISTLVKENGKVVLSGILAVQVEECLAAFHRPRFVSGNTGCQNSVCSRY